MIISCPECQTKYRLSEEKVKPQGSRARCSRCGHVFTARPEDDITWALQDQETGESALQGPEKGAFSETGGNGPENTLPKPQKRRPGPVFLVLVLILLLGLGGAVYWPQIKAWLPYSPSQDGQSMQLSQKTETSSLTQAIGLKNVRQYMVDNQDMGRILVIEGQAENTSQTAKKRIKVQATLFDDAGDKVVEQAFLCGNTASLYQLQTLDQEELESVLSSQAGVLANNSHLAPKQKVSFMAFFSQVPHQVAEFSLKVVQAQKAEQHSGQ